MPWHAFDLLGKLWLVLAAFWLLTAIGQKRAVFTAPAGVSVAHRIGAVGAFLLMYSGWFAVGPLRWRITPLSAPLEWTALVVGVAGFALAFWARILLGGEWSSRVTLKTDHRLIMSGPYAVVRHPIYSGLLLAMLGTALAGGELRMYIAAALLFATFWHKSQLEEQLLVSAMGERYLDYKRHTYALIPGLL